MDTVRFEDDKVLMIDQTKLPNELEYLELESVEEVAIAIEELKVRGAPAIGVSAAFGLLLASKEGDLEVLEEAADRLRRTRPTAVNLFWAIDRVMDVVDRSGDWQKAVEKEAKSIFMEDREINKRMGDNGADLLDDGDTVLTHCNAGALATSGMYGTALGVIKRAVERDIDIDVVCTETRPVLQGARLTSYELTMDIGVDTTLIVDSAVGALMPKIDKVVVGADRVARDGVANKIGTYNIAVLADRHGVEFYVAAPKSTFDEELTIDEIEIEERSETEIKQICGCQIAPNKVKAYNQAFDLTPAELIDGVITEDGVTEL
ncbi:Methylthioribose-1-phosphate isomerase MtnA, eIF-2B-like [Methanonatronarchaeum thermophilum]|uniref:Putative methylthioribose-1-phosphate isomerase n=1 Tax=Methanonatronarchaeum thermophilum TaxID=1927129 RepID=A0A1Y3GIJ4_9EURY|nr:S-methyl-5-thioribose-1-phosphate isomerase [Methanonatronarchaeum thermophilum]OUJ19255.1 Methylthioribose-1-phosphate isomerase MtnA, eIF-2B-like [Methanonatronarchaeum thermophilum]